MVCCIFENFFDIFSSFRGILQDGSKWLFTNRRTSEAHPFTMHVNFDKFSEGLKMKGFLAVHNMSSKHDPLENNFLHIYRHFGWR